MHLRYAVQWSLRVTLQHVWHIQAASGADLSARSAFQREHTCAAGGVPAGAGAAVAAITPARVTVTHASGDIVQDGAEFKQNKCTSKV
jgi:hypothetical protein